MGYQHLVIGLLALLSCINAESYLGTGYETVYDYFGDVRAGTNFPAEFASQFGIKAKLRVQYVDSAKATFKFSDVSYQVSTGPLADQEQPKAKFISAPKDSAYLYEPFQVIYDHGTVKNVLTVDEPEWSENIKKAVASIFQLDIQHLRFEKPYSFTTEEPSLYGECSVGYTVQPKGDGYVDVIKTQEYNKCKNMPFRYYTNGIYEPVPFEYKDDSLLEGSIRYYKLLTGKGRIEVKEIFSQSAIAAVPFNGASEDQTIFVRQNFTLISLDTIKQKIEFTPKHERDLKYSIPSFYNEVGSYSDLTGGREIKKKEEYMKLAQETLEELVDFMEVVKVSEEPEKLNNKLSQRLLYYYGQFDLDCFNKCFEMYMKPTTYREENLRGAFLELVAQVGSKASVLFIRDLIVNHKISDDLAIEVLRLVPFYVRDPDVSLLHQYETFFNTQLNEKVKKAAVLSVSNFVFLTYRKVHDIELINVYAKKFYDYFKEASEYELKLNYLTALANLEEGNAFDYLIEIVNDRTYSHHLRYIALWGTKHAAMKDHVKGYNLYWPIFSNDREEIDIRAAAMKLIMETEPTFDHFLSVFWYMQAETNSQLYYYYYTGLESLSSTHHPYFKTLGHHAERIFRYAKKPTATYLFTGDYMMDHMDTKHSIGGNTILSLIGDQYSGALDTIYYSQGGYYGGYNHDYFGVLIKVSGIVDFYKDKLPKFDLENVKVDYLQKIFTSLNIKPNHHEEFHVEVVFYTSERVVETRYYDIKNIENLVGDFRVIGKQFQGDFRIRQHNLIFAGIHEYIQPTDIGFPAVWNLATPYSFSVVANFTHDTTGPRITRKNAVEIRYGRYGGHSLSFYNPFGGVWQGAYRLHSHMFTLPIYNHLSIDGAQKHVKFAITRDLKKDFNLAMAYHVRSEVFVSDSSKSNALQESCPTCKPHVTIHAPEKVSRELNLFNYDSQETGLKYSLNLFDCDQPHTPYDIAHTLYDVFDSHELNYGHSFFNRFYAGFRKLHMLLNFQPYVGSCGLVVSAVPSEKYPYTQLEGVMHLIYDEAKDNNVVFLAPGGKYQFRGSFTLKGDDAEHVYSTYDLNAILEYTHDYIENHLSVKLTHNAPKEKEFKFCMDAETKYPELPSDIYVLRKESEEDVNGKFTVVWGDSVDGKCPTDGSGFKVTMTASVPHYNDVQRETEYPFNVCKHDYEEPEWKGKSFTPITPACVKAALDFTTLHKFAGNIKYFNFPEKYFSYGSKFIHFFENVGGFLITHEKKENHEHLENIDPHYVKGKHFEMKYVVEFENERPYLDFNMSWEGEKYEDYYQVKYDSFGFEPFLTSSRFFLLKRFGYNSGFWGSCVVTPSSVLTFDNDTYHYKSSQCYTLVNADCGKDPRYAVFTKKVQGPFDLAVKFFSAGHYFEIIPDQSGHFNVFIDGKPVQGGLRNGYKYPEDEDTASYIFKITKKDNFINIDSKYSFVEVDYTGYSVVVSTPGLYRGISCGLCGDFNGDDFHYERIGDVSHDCHRSYLDAVDGEYLGYRYTYRDEKCPEITEEMTKQIHCVGHYH